MTNNRLYINYLKLEKLRKNRLGRPRPYLAFHKNLDLILELNKIVSKSSKNKNVLNELRKLEIIGLVTTIETDLRDLLLKLVDEGNIKLSEKTLNKMGKYKFANISIMLVNGYTIGELLASSYNFQNLSNIKNIFNEILEIDTFSEFRKFLSLPEIKSDFNVHDSIYVSFIKNLENTLEMLLQNRHDIVHDINFKASYSQDKFINFLFFTHIF